MNRVPPSERISQVIRELLESGVMGDKDVLNELIWLGSKRLVQEILEQGVEDFWGRGRCEYRKERTSLRAIATGAEKGS